MKATLEFNLPEEDEEYRTCIEASRLKSAMWDFSQEVLRRLDKYGIFNGKELTEDESRIVSYIREEFYNHLRDREVSLD